MHPDPEIPSQVLAKIEDEPGLLVDTMRRGDNIVQRYERFVEAENEACDPQFKEEADINRNEEC
jgi:hypothetical protein